MTELAARERSAIPPSYSPGVRARVHRRLAHHNRLLIGLAPILVLLALGPEARFLRGLLVLMLTLSVADALLNPLLLARTAVWADLPSSVDLGHPTAIPVRVTNPSGVVCGAQFVRGLESPKLRALTDHADGSIIATAVERGVWETVTLQTEGGGILNAMNHALDFLLTPRQPLLAVPAAIVDPVVDRWLDRLRADLEPETAGLRPFREGDRRRDVQWVSSARVGAPVVVDRVPVAAPSTSLEIVAAAPTEAALVQTLGRARHAAERARGFGWQVSLTTRSTASATLSTVVISSDRSLLEALAVAVPGPAVADASGGPISSDARSGSLVLDSDGLR